MKKMPFSYYQRLDREDRATYRQSDQLHAVRVHHGHELQPLAAALEAALKADDLARVRHAAQQLSDALTERLRVPPVAIEVLPERPVDADGGELHGIYTSSGDEPPLVRLWMRTARHRRVVAYKTFLRTLLHELCHHLDFELFHLPQSFHTAGFFKRESSLFHQLVPRDAKKPDRGPLLPGIE